MFGNNKNSRKISSIRDGKIRAQKTSCLNCFPVFDSQRWTQAVYKLHAVTKKLCMVRAGPILGPREAERYSEEKHCRVTARPRGTSSLDQIKMGAPYRFWGVKGVWLYEVYIYMFKNIWVPGSRWPENNIVSLHTHIESTRRTMHASYTNNSKQTITYRTWWKPFSQRFLGYYDQYLNLIIARAHRAQSTVHTIVTRDTSVHWTTTAGVLQLLITCDTSPCYLTRSGPNELADPQLTNW